MEEGFENLTDKEKLSFYDSRIKKLLKEIEYQETQGVYFSAGQKEETIKRTERKIENLRSERASLLDRINIGLSNSSHLMRPKQIFIASWFDSSTDDSISARLKLNI